MDRSLLLALLNAIVELGRIVLDGMRIGPAAALRIDVVSHDPVQFLSGVSSMVLTNTQKVSAVLRPVDAAGNPAKVDGPPSWDSSNPNIARVLPSGDGLSAVVEALGPAGHSTLTVTADADLGAGTRPIVATAEIEVVAGEAVTVAIEFGTPEAK